jgi:hypothetical protein
MKHATGARAQYSNKNTRTQHCISQDTIGSPIGLSYLNTYEGRLIGNAHSELFCRRSKVAMRALCVLVATTLLHSGAKFPFSTPVLKQCVLT